MSKEDFKNISHFKKYGAESRGTNEKEWLLTPDKSLCLYKITQIKEDQTSTNAHYSESIYSDICKLLDVPCCKVELAKSLKRKGIISYYFLEKDEELIDFNALIQNIRQDYVPKSLKCKKTQEYYSIDLILEAIKAVANNREEYKKISKQLFELIIVDSLCDHYDRNSSNLALIRNYQNPHHPTFNLAPAYDNGTSLEMSLPIEVAKNYLEEPDGIQTLDERIISKIGIGTKRGATYNELLNYLFENHIEEFEDIINKLNYNLNENELLNVLFKQKYKHLDTTRKKLTLVKVLYNKEKIINLYKIYKNNKIKTLKK